MDVLFSEKDRTSLDVSNAIMQVTLRIEKKISARGSDNQPSFSSSLSSRPSAATCPPRPPDGAMPLLSALAPRQLVQSMKELSAVPPRPPATSPGRIFGDPSSTAGKPR